MRSQKNKLIKTTVEPESIKAEVIDDNSTNQFELQMNQHQFDMDEITNRMRNNINFIKWSLIIGFTLTFIECIQALI